MQFPFRQLEIRVLGCLIEKELTTPEYYPLTLNALTLACNQKSNRHPILNETEATIKEAMLGLQKRELCHTVYQHRSRSGRYKHHLDEKYGFSNEEKAVLCELFLRGPQTPGELNARASRMAPFASIEAVDACLARLAEHPGGPYVKQLQRQPGQKESRFAHLFCGEEGLEEQAADSRSTSPITDKMEAVLRRIEALEEQVADLSEAVERLNNR